MRIMDWSSDVCSSDLRLVCGPFDHIGLRHDRTLMQRLVVVQRHLERLAVGGTGDEAGDDQDFVHEKPHTLWGAEPLRRGAGRSARTNLGLNLISRSPQENIKRKEEHRTGKEKDNT